MLFALFWFLSHCSKYNKYLINRISHKLKFLIMKATFHCYHMLPSDATVIHMKLLMRFSLLWRCFWSIGSLFGFAVSFKMIEILRVMVWADPVSHNMISSFSLHFYWSVHLRFFTIDQLQNKFSKILHKEWGGENRLTRMTNSINDLAADTSLHVATQG